MQYGLSDQYADELPFIREILFDVDDPTPRMIYSDWLEERGDIRGEFMRLDQQLYELGLQDPGATEIRKRRTKLILQIDQRWTTLLAQAPIEECDLQKEFAFLCPKRWRNLKPSGDDKDVRYCDQCG
ncbi:MAG: TIGR02996 domain-containing protein, partial [Rubripirellula sp.]